MFIFISLTRVGPHKMTTMLQTTFSNAFSGMKMYEFRLRFHWRLCLRVQLTIFEHWSRYWLKAHKAKSLYMNLWWLVYWRRYVSHGINELKLYWLKPEQNGCCNFVNDDVIKWKYFPRYWPFVRGIHRSPVNSPHKGQWRGTLMFSLICAWIDSLVNSREAGDLRRYCVHYDVSENMGAIWISPSTCIVIHLIFCSITVLKIIVIWLTFHGNLSPKSDSQ